MVSRRLKGARWPELAVLLLTALCASVVYAQTSVGSCKDWPALPHAELRQLSPCMSAATARQIGQVCVHHQWRCGLGDFGHWFARWAQSVNEPFAASLEGEHWIYSSVSQEDSWAVFWSPEVKTTDGFVVLVSRLRPAKARP